MLQIDHTNCSSSGDLLDTLTNTSVYYGFAPFETAVKEEFKKRILKPRSEPTIQSPLEKKLFHFMKTCASYGIHRSSEPHCFYAIDTKSSKTASIDLHVVGAKSAIAEGILLASLIDGAYDCGIESFVVHINSVGDKESYIRYTKELQSFLRERINDLPAYARDELLAGNVVKSYCKLVDRNHEYTKDAPSSIDYLNDESRDHFHDVLEYVEHMDIQYELNPTLLGSGDCWNHTIFEIRVPTDNGNYVVFARGGRHDTLAQKTYRIDIPSVSATIEHELKGRTKQTRYKEIKPSFFFAQLGMNAKMKSFSVVSQCKNSGIPIAHSIAVESIGDQLKNAERLSVPYTVIIGHKEALEDSAIVRNMYNHSQTIVPLKNLPSYLKRLKV